MGGGGGGGVALWDPLYWTRSHFVMKAKNFIEKKREVNNQRCQQLVHVGETIDLAEYQHCSIIQNGLNTLS